MVKTRVMKIKNLRELKNTCDGKHEGLFDESGLNHAQIKASTKIHLGRRIIRFDAKTV